MKKLSKSQISPLELHIEDKMRTAYLFHIAEKALQLDFIQFYIKYVNVNDSPDLKQNTNSHSNK